MNGVPASLFLRRVWGLGFRVWGLGLGIREEGGGFWGGGGGLGFRNPEALNPTNVRVTFINLPPPP